MVWSIYKNSVNNVSTYWLDASEAARYINNNFRYLWRETSTTYNVELELWLQMPPNNGAPPPN